MMNNKGLRDKFPEGFQAVLNVVDKLCDSDKFHFEFWISNGSLDAQQTYVGLGDDKLYSSTALLENGAVCVIDQMCQSGECKWPLEDLLQPEDLPFENLLSEDLEFWGSLSPKNLITAVSQVWDTAKNEVEDTIDQAVDIVKDGLDVVGDAMDAAVEAITQFAKELAPKCRATSNSPNSLMSFDFPPIVNSLKPIFCMDLSGGRTHNGNEVIIHTCHHNNNQRWWMDPDGRIRSMANLNKCLEAGTPHLNAKLFIWDCNDGIHQQWDITPDGRIRSKQNDERYIGVAHGCNGISSGGRLEIQQKLYSGACKLQQEWSMGFPQIVNSLNPNFCMDLSGGRTHNGNEVIIHTCHHNNNQRWWMDPDGRIRSMANLDKCLEAGTPHLNAKLFIWDCNDEIHQQWKITPDGRIRSKQNNERYIGVAHGCNGIVNGGRLEIQRYISDGSSCERQQEWSMITTAGLRSA
eukprot:scaffold571_cov34-Cyclotella_meneghiniana.AAC.7